ncbi:hypothetical protein GKR41_00643 [Candidatus Vallotia lariciata]|nr:hypothetical protein GKR41_00643 [Candidatus Vallotia lariciata]
MGVVIILINTEHLYHAMRDTLQATVDLRYAREQPY